MNNSEIALPIILTTLLILILIAGIAIAFFISGRERIKQQIKLTETRLIHEKELRQAETEVSEAMMEQFSRELHDNIGHLLTCMKITIENKKLDNPELLPAFAPIEGYLDETATQLRLLSRSLNSDYVNSIGLSAAIQLEIERIVQLRTLLVNYDYDNTALAIGKNEQLMIFRIFQEMVQNCIKHARAKHLNISLKGTNGFKLEISDDGKGFDSQTMLNSPKASGLKNMLKRAGIINMECTINSEPGKGCICTLYFCTPDNIKIN